MDFSFTDDQRLIRDTVRHFMEAEVRPNVRERDREEKFAAAEMRRLGELGCCGMLIPGRVGRRRLGHDLLRVDARRGGARGRRHGRGAERHQFRRRLAALEAWHGTSSAENICRASRAAKFSARFCLTEPQAGSDAAAIADPRERSATARLYRLNGTKTWVTNGGEAASTSFLPRTRSPHGSAGARGKSSPHFSSNRPFPAFASARYEDKMGLRTFALGGNRVHRLPSPGGKSPRAKKGRG